MGSAMMMGIVATKAPGYDFLASAIQKTQTKEIKIHVHQDLEKPEIKQTQANQMIRNPSEETRGRSETLSHDEDH